MMRKLDKQDLLDLAVGAALFSGQEAAAIRISDG